MVYPTLLKTEIADIYWSDEYQNQTNAYIKTLQNNIKNQTLTKVNDLMPYLYVMTNSWTWHETDTKFIARKRDLVYRIQHGDNWSRQSSDNQSDDYCFALGYSTKSFFTKNRKTIDDLFHYKRYQSNKPDHFIVDNALLAALKADYRVVLLNGIRDYLLNYHPKFATNQKNLDELYNLPNGCLLFTNLKGDKYYFAYPIDLRSDKYSIYAARFNLNKILDLTDEAINTINEHRMTAQSKYLKNKSRFLYTPIINVSMTFIKSTIDKSPVTKFKKAPAFTANTYTNYTYRYTHIGKSIDNERIDALNSGINKYDLRDYLDTFDNIIQIVVRSFKYKLTNDGLFQLKVPDDFAKYPYWHNLQNITFSLFANTQYNLSTDIMQNQIHYTSSQLNYYLYLQKNNTTPILVSTSVFDRKNCIYHESKAKEFTFDNSQTNYKPLMPEQNLAKLFTIISNNKEHEYFVENKHLISGWGSGKLKLFTDLDLN